MTLFSLTHGLHRDDQPAARAAAVTHVGQAHFAYSGPPGRTCRDCARWQFTKQWSQKNGPFPSRCAKYRELMREWGRKVPHNAGACKYFEARDTEIPIVRPDKIHG